MRRGSPSSRSAVPERLISRIVRSFRSGLTSDQDALRVRQSESCRSGLALRGFRCSTAAVAGAPPPVLPFEPAPQRALLLFELRCWGRALAIPRLGGSPDRFTPLGVAPVPVRVTIRGRGAVWRLARTSGGSAVGRIGLGKPRRPAATRSPARTESNMHSNPTQPIVCRVRGHLPGAPVVCSRLRRLCVYTLRSPHRAGPLRRRPGCGVRRWWRGPLARSSRRYGDCRSPR
jgi:hypothetical protein